MSETLDIDLLGKTYRVACAPGERESLDEAVALLEARLAALRGKTRTPSERLAVMVALELAHELVQRQRGAVAESTPLAGMEQPLAREELKRRIDLIEARMVSALEQTESLF